MVHVAFDQQQREKLVKFSLPLGRMQHQAGETQKVWQDQRRNSTSDCCKNAEKTDLGEEYDGEKFKNTSFDIAAEFSEGFRDILVRKVVGRRICHVWYESGGKVMYNGKIEKLKKKGVETYMWYATGIMRMRARHTKAE
ncbi:hypothetical protein SNE40_022081 [Patella caerulea]|uniref:Uncharacterized protein n=1 Tax=Patella caerulea TaxID=87958 RepID=A0AAN8G0X8_PATCE